MVLITLIYPSIPIYSKYSKSIPIKSYGEEL